MFSFGINQKFVNFFFHHKLINFYKLKNLKNNKNSIVRHWEKNGGKRSDTRK